MQMAWLQFQLSLPLRGNASNFLLPSGDSAATARVRSFLRSVSFQALLVFWKPLLTLLYGFSLSGFHDARENHVCLHGFLWLWACRRVAKARSKSEEFENLSS